MLLSKSVLAGLALAAGQLLETLYGQAATSTGWLPSYAAVAPALYALPGIPRLAGVSAGVSSVHHFAKAEGGTP
jgi:hypothetical protein